MLRGHRDVSLRPYARISRPGSLLFLLRRHSVVLSGVGGLLPEPLIVRKSGRGGNRTRTSGSVARNSDFFLNII
jgi:hypothetical protein